MRKTDWQRLFRVEHEWGGSVLFAVYSMWVSQPNAVPGGGGPWYIRLLNRREKSASDIRPEAHIPTANAARSTTDKRTQGIPKGVVELADWSPPSLHIDTALHNRDTGLAQYASIDRPWVQGE